MKNALLVTLSAVLAMTVALATVPAHAQQARSSRQVAASAKITIVIIRDYYGPDDFQQVSPIYRYPSAKTFAKGQEEIRSNPSIRALLQRRGIASHNVNGVQTALNGGKIIYVK